MAGPFARGDRRSRARSADSPPLFPRLTALAPGVSGAASVLLGAVVLLGWALDAPRVKSLSPEWPSMKVNTALCFLALGSALATFTSPSSRWSAPRRVLAAIAVAVGIATLLQYAFDVELAIDELFVEDRDPVLTSHPGRPSPLTAVCFAALGIAMMLQPRRETSRGSALQQGIVIVVAFLLLVATAGYLYDVEPFFGATDLTTGIAAHTIAGLVVLTVGFQAVLPGTTRAWNARTTPAGRLLLVLIPAAVLLPLAIGYVALLGERSGAYGPRFRLSLTMTATVAALSLLAVVAAREVGRADADRRLAYEELRRSHREIEARVHERTAELAATLGQRDALARIVEGSADAIVSFDKDGRVRSWNEGARLTYGYTPEEALGRSILDLIIPREDHEAHEDATDLMRRVWSGEKVRAERVVRRRKDGRTVQVDLTAFQVQVEVGSEPRAASISRDVTHLVRLEEALRRSNRDLQDFAYVASHDLQEPLRMVSSYCELIRERYSEDLDETGREFLAFAVDGARRMQALIDDLLRFSRVATKGKPFVVTDPRDAVERAFLNVRSSAAQAQADLIAGELPASIEADPVQLVQLFQNLVSNAIKFHRPGVHPRVRVDAARVKGGWEFRVEDNGIGIAAKHQEKVFEPFRRLHTREEYEGTGMGLAICKRIVERRGGTIWIRSAEGAGTTIHFTIPDEVPEVAVLDGEALEASASTPHLLRS